MNLNDDACDDACMHDAPIESGLLEIWSLSLVVISWNRLFFFVFSKFVVIVVLFLIYYHYYFVCRRNNNNNSIIGFSGRCGSRGCSS
mmetsp:Transcript_17569/g.33349  ORF Transcript_17569/g.33349 Transcript_17569/m.33349 type:complete len:87 (-) Transcript_17569:790-1050(-)